MRYSPNGASSSRRLAVVAVREASVWFTIDPGMVCMHQRLATLGALGVNGRFHLQFCQSSPMRLIERTYSSVIANIIELRVLADIGSNMVQSHPHEEI